MMKNKLLNVLQELHIDQAVSALCDMFTFVAKVCTKHKNIIVLQQRIMTTGLMTIVCKFRNFVQCKLIMFRLSSSEETLMEYKIVKQHLLKKKKYTFRMEKQQFLLDSLYSHDVKSFSESTADEVKVRTISDSTVDEVELPLIVLWMK